MVFLFFVTSVCHWKQNKIYIYILIGQSSVCSRPFFNRCVYYYCRGATVTGAFPNPAPPGLVLVTLWREGEASISLQHRGMLPKFSSIAVQYEGFQGGGGLGLHVTR